MALDCFFAVWFVVGNVWIFGGHSNPEDAPKLYKYDLLTLYCYISFGWEVNKVQPSIG